MEYKYKFQGQERQDELGLNWDSFKWRNYDYTIGRFMCIDPLAEEYSFQSPYNFAENKVISHIELEGLEGIHHTIVDKAGNKSHVIEKNVVVLTRQTSSSYSDKKNARITAENNNKVATIKEQLNSNYSNAKNSKGESVDFKFNVTGLEIKNTDGPEKNEFKKLADENGLVSSEVSYVDRDGKDVFKISPAAIITTDFPGSTNGGSTEWGCKISLDGSFDSLSHEVGHTLETRDQENAHEDGGVLGHPQGHVNEKEVDKMLEDSYEN